MDLDLRRVRYFATIARRLSFVHAATQLHLTQPALTRQIQALESELGVRLLDRDRRGTSLTRAGQELLDGAGPLLAAATELERRVRAASRGEQRFTVGFMPGVPTTSIVRAFAESAPQLLVESIYTPMVDQEDFLLDGRVDVCFVRLPVRQPAITTIPILQEPRVAVVPQSSPLAGAEGLRLDDLQMHPLIDDPRTVPEWTGDTLPRDDPFATVEDRLEAVASGAGFTVLPVGIAEFYRRDDVVVIALDGITPVTVAVAYLHERAMPEVATFARLAREQLSTHG